MTLKSPAVSLFSFLNLDGSKREREREKEKKVKFGTKFLFQASLVWNDYPGCICGWACSENPNMWDVGNKRKVVTKPLRWQQVLRVFSPKIYLLIQCGFTGFLSFRHQIGRGWQDEERGEEKNDIQWGSKLKPNMWSSLERNEGPETKRETGWYKDKLILIQRDLCFLCTATVHFITIICFFFFYLENKKCDYY